MEIRSRFEERLPCARKGRRGDKLYVALGREESHAKRFYQVLAF
jgi:hypothetical protein